MQSRIEKRIGFVALLLLVIAVLFPFLTAKADSETTASIYTVTVNIADGQSEYGSCKIEVTGGGTKVGDNTYTSGTEFKITATAKSGYVATSIVKATSTAQTETPNDSSVNPFEWIGSVTEDLTFTVNFQPKEYKLNYASKDGISLSFPSGVSRPTTYTYGTSITLPTLVDTAEYTFQGWSRTGNENDIIDGEFSLSPAISDNEITLYAIFKPKQFKVTRLDKDAISGGVIGSYEFWADYKSTVTADKNLLDGTTFKEYKGYTYTDATGNYSSGTVTSAETGIVIERKYTPNEYAVTFDANGGVGGTTSATVKFNRKLGTLAELPTRAGYAFGGYKTTSTGVIYVNEKGEGIKEWDEDNSDRAFTLTAIWVKNTYTVSLSEDLWNNLASAVLGGKTYDGTPLSFEFDTKITIVLTAKDGYKLVACDGKTLTHTATYSLDYTVPASNSAIGGKVLPICTAPTVKVDYANEKISVADGSQNTAYVLKHGTDEISFGSSDSVTITKYLGSTVQILPRGDGSATADGEWTTVTLASRPDAPVCDNDGDLEKPTADEKSVTFTIPDGDSDKYEFACTRRIDDRKVWQDSAVFQNLEAGTTYTFHIRIKATDSAPHGEECSVTVYTLNENYLKGKIEELRGNVESDDGQNVNELITIYVAKMESLKPSSDYQTELQELIDECLAKLVLARYKDREIAKIEADCQERTDKNLYSDEGLSTLNSLEQTAITAINDAATTTGVDNARKEYDAKVAEIPVRMDLTYLFVAIGSVIFLQVIVLIILLSRRSKYNDVIRYERGKLSYVSTLPVYLLASQFLPEKSALLALLMGAVALILQIVITVILFQTIAIAKKVKQTEGDKQDKGDKPNDSEKTDSDEKSEKADTPATAGNSAETLTEIPTDDRSETQTLQEEDWYDDSIGTMDDLGDDDAPELTALPDDSEENQ